MGNIKKSGRFFDWSNLMPVLFAIALVLLILMSIVVGQMNAGLSSLEDFGNSLNNMIDSYDW